jgi:aryl-alcohol dehydrogenase-like predicted oxidoreductase
MQAAYRLAFELPTVQRVAVGTRKVGHLHELVDAVKLRVADGTINRYRELIGSSESAGTSQR